MWETEYKKTELCLKQRGRKAVVVSIPVRRGENLGSGFARLYEGWLNGVKIYDPRDHFKVGQILELTH